jgi:hypothetical protein
MAAARPVERPGGRDARADGRPGTSGDVEASGRPESGPGPGRVGPAVRAFAGRTGHALVAVPLTVATVLLQLTGAGRSRRWRRGAARVLLGVPPVDRAPGAPAGEAQDILARVDEGRTTSGRAGRADDRRANDRRTDDRWADDGPATGRRADHGRAAGGRATGGRADDLRAGRRWERSPYGLGALPVNVLLALATAPFWGAFVVRGIAYPLVADNLDRSWGGPTLAGAWAAHVLVGLGAVVAVDTVVVRPLTAWLRRRAA